MAGIPHPGIRRHQAKAEDARHLRRPQSLRSGRGARAGHRVFPHRKKVLKAPDTSKARVLVVGDVMLDRYWYGDASRISPEAPVPVLLFREEEYRLGGAANVAANCAKLGALTLLLAVVGMDEAGERLEKLLKKEGVDAKLQHDRRVHTTQKLRVIGRRQQLLRIDMEAAPSSQVLASKLADYKRALHEFYVVLLNDYGNGGLAHVATMLSVLRD